MHVIVLNASRHQAFLREHRRDPVTRKVLEPGDRVVLCAGDRCGLAFLEESWRAVGERHGRHTGTLPDAEAEAPPAHPGEAGHGSPPPGRARAKQTAPGLKEVPSQLKGIPFSLTEVAGS